MKIYSYPLRYRVMFFALVFVVIAMIFAIRFSAPSRAAEKSTGHEDGQVIELAEADVASVQLASINRTLVLSGTLQPLRQSTLTAEVEGRTLAVEVRAGNKVAAGQILARFDARDLQSRLAEQRARFASSQAQFLLSEKNQRRNEELLARKFISAANLDNGRSTLDANRENMKAQQAQMALAQQAVDKAVIRTPLAGIVAERLIDPGQAVVPGARLFTVIDLSDLELAANVPVSEVGSIRPGQSIQLLVTGVTTLVTGTVERIAPTADLATRMIPVYIRIHNPTLELKGGMLVQGRLAIATGKAGLAVHGDFIRWEGGQTFVQRIKDGAMEQVLIEAGLKDDATGQVQVRKGLFAGDRVVLAKIKQLAPGQLVVMHR